MVIVICHVKYQKHTEHTEVQCMAGRAMLQINQDPLIFGAFIPIYSDSQEPIWEALEVHIIQVIFWRSDEFTGVEGAEWVWC